MKDFDIALEQFKLDSLTNHFDDLVQKDPYAFFDFLFERLHLNYVNSSNASLSDSIQLLCVIQALGEINDGTEKIITEGLLINFHYFTQSYFRGTYRELQLDECYKNIFIFIDLFFHNPYWLENLAYNRADDLANQLIKLTDIKYELPEVSNIQLAVEYAVTVLGYLPDNIIEKYRTPFENHFDNRVAREARDL